MKRKNVLYMLFLSLMIAATACQPEEPDDDQPIDDPRTAYTGSWLCNELGGQSYTVQINLDSANSTQVKFYNFHHLGFDEMVRGVVAGSTVTLPSQTACAGTITIEGTATMSSSNTNMDFIYYVDDGSNIDTIQASYVKQN